MQYGQKCEWLILPNTIHGVGSYTNMDRSIVLEFTESDMRGGGSVEVYDGASDVARLLWRCDGCQVRVW